MRNKLDARHEFIRRFGTPENWKLITLGEVTDVVGGGTPSRDEGRFWQYGAIPWVTPTDLTANQSKYISNSADSITEAGLASSAAILLPAGTVLYTSRATIGAKAIAEIPIATNQGFASFVPREIDGGYLYYLLEFLTPVIKRLAAGTTFDEVSKRDIRTVHCSIPILSIEQAAIARILDAVDTAIERAQDAVRVAAEVKSALVQEFFYAALGMTAYADRPSQKLPSGWVLSPMEALIIGEPKNGVSPKCSSQPPGTPTFSIAAIRGGRVDLANGENLKYAEVSPKVLDKFRISKGDILIVRGNANPELVGKAGRVTDFPDDCIYPDIAKRVLLRDSGNHQLLPEFAVFAWNHPIVHNQILRRAKTSNGTLKINNRDVKQIVVPVPPIERQEEIVGLTLAADRMLDALKAKQSALTTLKKSLMHDLLTGTVRVADCALDPPP